MASTYLTRTLGNPTNAYKGTLSWWQKGMNVSSTQYILACESGSERQLWYGSAGAFQGGLRGTSSPPDIDFTLSGTPKFRDTSGWYHCVLAWDTTLSTGSDRYKYYVNGVEFTISGSGSSSTIPQNHVMPMNKNGLPFRIGSTIGGGSYFEGIMSHIHFCDGTQYQASDFGETDSTTGEWKIKTDPSVTYGNNGFWWLKDTNAATDSSPNSNTPTIGGTLTKTEDCPNNVFATFNALAKHGTTTSNQSDFLKNGNTTFYTPSDNNARKGLFLTSLGATSGKYYCEYKQGGGDRLITGICNANIFAATNEPYVNSNQSALLYLEVNSEIKYDGANYSTGIQSGTSGDIFGFALDLDNKHWYIHKNGTYFNSGDPTSGSTGTGSIIAATSTSAYFNHGEMFFCAGDFDNGSYATSEWNFGNGYFGTTAVSSAGTNASNLGIFEYDVPTGYTALCTKGLNE